MKMPSKEGNNLISVAGQKLVEVTTAYCMPHSTCCKYAHIDFYDSTFNLIPISIEALIVMSARMEPEAVSSERPAAKGSNNSDSTLILLFK